MEKINKNKKEIGIIITNFLPGEKLGGPIHSIYNLVQFNKEYFDFFILTTNKDFLSLKPYNLKTNVYIHKYGCKIKYVKKITFKEIYNFINQFKIVILTSFFSKPVIRFLILNIFLNFKSKIIIKPMGVFSLKAFKFKFYKKLFFTYLFNIFLLKNNITFSFSSKLEYLEASKFIKINKYFIVDEHPNPISLTNNLIRKRTDKLRILFVSRISPKKNLDFAISIINKLDIPYSFKIIGNIEDHKYYEKCKKLINNNNNVTFLGHKSPIDVKKIFAQSDIFLFPTKGENFGHVIFEALICGCIPFITNLTPFNDINSFAYVFTTFDSDLYVKKIYEYYKLPLSFKIEKSKQAINYANSYIDRLKLEKKIFYEINNL